MNKSSIHSLYVTIGSNCDWGRYNAISNGGDEPNIWRLLTRDEFNYILKSRMNASNLRFKATIMVDNVTFKKIEVCGLCPDDFICPSHMFLKNENEFSLEDFKILSKLGVFFYLSDDAYWTSTLEIHPLALNDYYTPIARTSATEGISIRNNATTSEMFSICPATELKWQDPPVYRRVRLVKDVE